jgi:hypothetical protein
VTASPEYSQHKKEKPVREKSLAGERNKMFELLLLILFLICYGFYRLCRFTRRQADREKTYWQDQKRFGKPIAYKIYTAVKVFLATVIIAAVTYIFIALAYGGCPTLTDLTNHKFQETSLGVGIILLPQIGTLILYCLLKRRQT